MMAKILRRLAVSEVSSVDRAANPGARILLMKRRDSDAQTDSAHPVLRLADELAARGLAKPGVGAIRLATAMARSGKMTKNDGMMVIKLDGNEFKLPDTPEWASLLKDAGLTEVTPQAVDKACDVVAIAKALIAGEINSTTLAAVDFHATMRAEAAKRYPQLGSPQQQVAKFIEDDPDGRALHQAAKAAVSYDVTQTTPVPRDSPSYRALVAMAREMATASPDKSYYDCLLESMASSRGRELYEASRQESALASLAVINGTARIGEWTDVDKLPPITPPDNPPNGLTDRRFHFPDGDARVPGRGQGYERFKAQVEKIQKANPALGAEEAQARARRDHPDLWREAKREGLAASARVAA